ncbi:MAG TPA: glycoside hydrolase family 30 beta sandwich domain-containing protein [Solirubrobacteraceae bacterium]|nr:glycoside hydrolase family 30 beta sandwich domain-containing protein [Solirubrobacteraceae bacterium]
MNITQTTANLSDALTPKRPRQWLPEPSPGSQVIAVNGRVRYQRIIGFGAAMTDSSAYLLQDQLTPEANTIAMQALFGQPGIRLNFVRIPIGASDFTATGVPYTYDDMPAGQTDPAMAAFSIAHDGAYIIPALREMFAQNRHIVTYANPWTPPPWMKDNDSYGNLGGAGTVRKEYYPALAQYFVKFIQAYEAAGVPIDDISMQNEPHTRASWPSAALLPGDAVDFLTQDLHPALAAAGLDPKVYGLEQTANPIDEQTLFAGPAAPELSGIGFHCYGGMGGFTTFHDAFPTVPIAETECSPGIIDYSAAEVAIDATRNWASVATLWNLALDPLGGPVQPPNSGCRGCTGVIRVNEQTHLATYGHNYFQFGQISRFVRRGAVRIASTRFVQDDGRTVTPGVDNVAFIDPGGMKVLVAYNSATYPISISIRWRRRYLYYVIRPGATDTFRWR